MPRIPVLAVPAPPEAPAPRPSIRLRPLVLAFGFDVATPRYWVRGDAFQTHFFNAFFTFTPPVEAFIARTVHRARAQVTDPALRECVQLFLGQEIRHGREHEKYNAALEARGYRVERMSRWTRFSLSVFAAAASLRTALALCVVLEHVASLMTEMLAAVSTFGRADNDVMRLAQWHAVEETEHRGVVFDVYEHLGGRYPTRAVLGALVCVPFILRVLRRQGHMLRKDGLLFRPATWRHSGRFLFGASGQLRIISNGFRRFMRRDFSPWSDDAHLEAIARWDEQSRRSGSPPRRA